ncbi:LPXTG cell wall anchor domain-containing protein [Gemella sanguinis]
MAKTGQAATNTGIIGVGLMMLATMIKRRKKR